MTEAQAWQTLRTSDQYQDAMQRVEDASAVRLTLEEVTEEGHLFWVWEDMGTHAATLERLLIAPDRQVYRFNSADAQWVREE